MERQLGLSIYPDKMSVEEIENYLKFAFENNFTRAYFTFLPINLLENNATTLLPQILNAIKVAKKIGFNITVDVNQRILDILKITISDSIWFQKNQIDIVRLDLPMDAQTIANLSYNQENIKFELQMSNPNFALQDILSYDPKKRNLLGCQNFYPQNYTGLSLKFFEKTSRPFVENGIKTTSYLTSQNPKAFCSWPNSKRTPTLEWCRNLPITVQAKFMWMTKQVDDLIIANCPALPEEIITLGKTDRFIFELDVELESNLNPIEKIVMFENQHQNRGDINDYLIRSTKTRVKYKNESNPKRILQVKYFEVGDILIGNDESGLYKNELQIVKTRIPKSEDKNLVAKLSEENLSLLNLFEPWLRFKLMS
ncbi:MupG family TIM beta-alpha barrel fold protein [Spiroplasma endosymbiont of Panorpa germanica]|uniref:MupG family TIM beta-alpha barrel fold protein n=1 Tax=Spiroplasma endosymbiont of Panorpa germanica TaxID=3066314 RepID=UPI0030CE10AE